jgi:crotonobetainyl-CoA:carnitine CoA-transferase CaiB-like acyl-CoA transferase
MRAPPRGPLNGITVIDLGQIYNGPYATFLMAMAGAQVIKIEPRGGENLRRRAAVGGAAMPFAMLNSNKHFVTLDLKQARGRELLLEMVRRGDVLVENFSVGAMERLGLGWERLTAENPRLIYASGTGYGRSGPMRDYPAMDIAVQAMSGLMSVNGYEDRPPVKIGPAVADFLGGVHLYAAIVTALHARSQTGRGQMVEVSMMEAVYASLASNLGLFHASGGLAPERTGNRHGGMAESPYNLYPALDGHIAIVASSDAQWRRLLGVIGRSDLIDDPRYATLSARVERMNEVDQLIEDYTSGRTRDQAFRELIGADITCAPVRNIAEVVDDEHLRARQALEWTDHPLYGRMPLPRSPLRFSDAPLATLEPSGEAGRDNVTVFGDWLGLGADGVAELERLQLI